MDLTAQNLSIGYGNRKLIADLNLSLHSGELTCLIGPNGTGKTTLIHTLSGVTEPLAGDIYYGKRSLKELSLFERSKEISLVLSQRLIPNNLSVFEIVSLGRTPYTHWFGKPTSLDMEMIQKAMEYTDVAQFSSRYIHELSDGEKQRVMIAKALAQDTPLMILDEPTAHLDVQHRVSLILLLKKLSRETGKTILISTHELEVAIELADKIWLINNNLEMKVGCPEDLVLKGDFSRLFHDEQLKFNQLNGSFDINYVCKTKYSIKDGGSLVHNWTVKALRKEGFIYSEDKQPLEIGIDESDETSWSVSDQKGVQTFDSLESLIKYLRFK